MSITHHEVENWNESISVLRSDKLVRAPFQFFQYFIQLVVILHDEHLQNLNKMCQNIT